MVIGNTSDFIYCFSKKKYFLANDGSSRTQKTKITVALCLDTLLCQGCNKGFLNATFDVSLLIDCGFCVDLDLRFFHFV